VLCFLIIDHDADARAATGRLLTEAFPACVVNQAGTGAVGARLALEHRPECVLLAPRLADMSGAQLLSRLSDEAGQPNFPVVVLTERDDTNAAAEAFRAGALNYLPKSAMTAEGLRLAVTGAVARLQTLRQRREQEATNAHVATILWSYWVHAPEPLYLMRIEPDGALICERANPSYYAMSGYTHEQTAERSPHDFLPSRAADNLVARVRQCAASGRPVPYQVAVDYPTGRRELENVLVPIRDPDGRVAHVLGSVRDVTERNALAARLARAQRLEAIGQLTGGIAHDFNNLLAVVMTNAGSLKEKMERLADWRSVRKLELIELAADRGARLASQLLAFARKQALRPEPVVVSALLNDISDLLQRAAGETASVELALSADVWPCSVDPAELQQVVLNLILNARDALPSQGGRITIEALNVTLEREAAARLSVEAGDYVRISVTDTGSGMPPEVVARAFEPFFTTKQVGRGSGLGLSQVHGFVGQSGGAVDIASEVSRGTTVTLYLPRERAASAGAASSGWLEGGVGLG
jgi:two-component system, cell cycle sensor histidine kinase and response regulator CckA